MDNLEFNSSYPSQVEEWKEILDAVKLRMRSDVKISSTLSGGLDSSAVVSAMQYLDREITPYKKIALKLCSSYKNSDLDETIWQNDYLNYFQLPLIKLKLIQKILIIIFLMDLH